ncbi:ABC-2 type transport system permease protein [Nonomuraea polychroma]|uniref:ABC-2 type transport system permease protein n=1 Tax=Nonomuraea polychroma TaxID=46176 RepID=A0A438MNQ7_9ACTN|nr:ABC transporter permease subunit [Nonomuraea polychroma]RVX47494.1 ABC-2 type transport system permease protein [Nonomuraea polychroma]
MRREIHAEWTKLRTMPGPGWLLAGMVVLTVSMSAVAAGAVTCGSAGCGHDATRLGLMGVQLGQAMVALLAVLAVCGEYSTGLIGTSLTAMPRRATMLAAKASVLTGLTLVAGTVAVLGCVLAGRLLLPGSGFTAAHGYAPLSLADGPTLRAAAGSVLYLGLIALLSVGVAIAVRDSATATGVVLSLLYLFPLAIHMVGDEEAQRFLWSISPTNAGLAIQATTDATLLPLGPWAGLGVLTVWAFAALLTGWVLLRRRDA